MGTRLSSLVLALVLGASSAAAQPPQAYVFTELGGSFGDGGTQGAVGAGFGYLTSRRVGLELDVSYVPSLDFDDVVVPAIVIFPPINVTASGRIIGLTTHVVGVLPGSGPRLRACVLAGGGIADVERRVRISYEPFVFPDFGAELEALGLTVVPFPRDVEQRRSHTKVVLSAGGGFEYEVTRRLGLGLTVKYQRLFSDPGAMDNARVGMRVTWGF